MRKMDEKKCCMNCRSRQEDIPGQLICQNPNSDMYLDHVDKALYCSKHRFASERDNDSVITDHR